MAAELIAVIRLLRMQKLREVGLEEIKQSAKVWAEEQCSNPNVRSYRKSAGNFVFVAEKWLSFHGKLEISRSRPARFADPLEDFSEYLDTEQGLSLLSIRSRPWKT